MALFTFVNNFVQQTAKKHRPQTVYKLN
uniref:Uncharacterized protein n=1 Tax=Ciona intestinalis TaxID=7719 RepID=H2XRW7_CIOIN